MAEGMDEEQLVSFCHQLGLAKDGYLSESDLAVVCRCIGLVAPEEMMKQLFEELDGDHDGRVCLAELSLMLRGMQLQQSQKPSLYSDKSSSDDVTEPPPMLGADPDHFTFSIFDQDHTGTAKVGAILDLWSQLGISPSVGQHVLKELGFSIQSKLSTISLQDLGRSIDEETEHSKEGDLPAVFLAALLTYRTEAQFLRTLCENVECERDKLKLDVAEAHQRSTMLAQEVDEQNARLERNSQLQLLKMESKYAEQIQTLQQSMGQEKETLLQTIQQLETQLTALREAEDRLKTSIAKLKEENAQLESETKNLTQEVKNVTWLKTKLQDELTRYAELEKGMQEMEKQNAAKASQSEEKLRRNREEIQGLKDQNDELSSQLERMKDALDGMKSLDGARFNLRRRRKKASTPKQELTKMDDDQSCVPLHKMGKFHQEAVNVNGVEHDVDDAESSLEHVFLSCSSQDIDSGTFQNLDRMNLDGCVMDESCTEAMQEEEHDDGVRHGSAEYVAVAALLEEYRKLRASMNAVKEKLAKLSPETELEVGSQSEKVDRVRELEEFEEARAGFEAERGRLRAQCGELERSLELLQAEYEKCEEYWHGKLQEERVEYEHDRNVNDEKFLELAQKIKEYEDLCLQETEFSNKLPPIEERASLEKQVTDLDDECQGLREQLLSLQTEQHSAIANYQRQAELKAREECGHLEQQVKALQQKCQEYEIRLTSLTEEGKEEESSSALRARVQELESELRVQKERHTEHVQDLERTWKRKNVQKSSHNEPQAPHTGAPAIRQPLHQNVNGPEGVGMMSQPPLGPFWAQSPDHLPFYHHATDQPLSLPYVPSSYGQPLNAGHNGFGLDVWSFPAGAQQQSGHQQPKKTWCHVEVGWLQALQAKLKHREDQCLMLQRALCSLEQQHERILTEMKFQHRAELSNWEDLMKGSQELVRQQTAKQKEQADKLAHADAVMKDLWAENNRLVAAFNSAQQRVSCLESLLGGAPPTHK